MKNEAGKGDSYRPVDRAKWGENFDRIFQLRAKKNYVIFHGEEDLMHLSIEITVVDTDTGERHQLPKRFLVVSPSLSATEFDDLHKRLTHAVDLFCGDLDNERNNTTNAPEDPTPATDGIETTVTNG